MRMPSRFASGASWVASVLVHPWETMQIRNQARKERAVGTPRADDVHDERPREGEARPQRSEPAD